MVIVDLPDGADSRAMRSNLLTLNTVAFELVPPNADLGREQALEEARKVLRFSKETGIDGRIGHVMMPGMIEEDDDRPIKMNLGLAGLNFWRITNPNLPGWKGLCTQATPFLDNPPRRHRRPVRPTPGSKGFPS